MGSPTSVFFYPENPSRSIRMEFLEAWVTMICKTPWRNRSRYLGDIWRFHTLARIPKRNPPFSFSRDSWGFTIMDHHQIDMILGLVGFMNPELNPWFATGILGRSSIMYSYCHSWTGCRQQKWGFHWVAGVVLCFKAMEYASGDPH